jgi:thioredoxin 1
MRKFFVTNLIAVSLIVIILGVTAAAAAAVGSKNLPVRGMVTMVDLGAASCIPCKMMAPILERLEKRYKGKAVIAFVDLRYDQEAAQRFGIRAIPTQIFYDRNGREITRHVGFMSEDAIVAQLKAMGVK